MPEATRGKALVTGASSGIGATYADRLAKRGLDLILVARDVQRLEALAARLREESGCKIEILAADLTDTVQVAAVATRIAEEPKLTLFVNNAGVALNGTLETAPADEVARLITLNVTASTLLVQAALRSFRERNSGGIIIVSSILAIGPEIMESVYSGTKAFLLNLAQGLVHELGTSNIRVQAVLPGATRTEIWERSGKDVDALPSEWLMEVGDLVDAGLLGFDRGEVVTIPPLEDERDWLVMQEARYRLASQHSRRDVASRYRPVADP